MEFGKKILVIIPAYNEEMEITGVIQEIHRYAPDAEILVVDDGSTDHTREISFRTGTRTVSHPFNLGYGTALQTAYKYALSNGYEMVIQMDGDGQHDPSFIPDLLAVIQKGEADIAIGSRFLAVKNRNSGLGHPSYRAPFLRRLGMRFFGTIASLLIHQKITDPTSGFQAMNRNVLGWVSSDKFPFDYPDADVIIMLHRAGFRIREVPVEMFENTGKKSMHSGWKPLYYVFKMCLSILVTLMRR